MLAFLDWVATTPVSVTLQNVAWMIPTLQAVHIFTIAVVFIAALVLDLRVLGVMGAGQSMPVLTHRFAPWIGWGVAVLLATGLLLMIGEPNRAVLNPVFQLKMAGVLIAAALTWALVAAVRRDPEGWADPARHAWARPLAIGSVALWLLLIWAGRWIAYT